MFSRPDTIAWIAGIFLLAIVTIGLGVTSLMESDLAAQGGEQQVFFTDANTGAQNIANAGHTDATDALGIEEGTSEEPSEENIITAGFKNLLNLGKIWNEAKDSATSGTKYLSIPPIYWLVGLALILITLSVVIYTWIRGK